jgi:hypothetical protein
MLSFRSAKPRVTGLERSKQTNIIALRGEIEFVSPLPADSFLRPWGQYGQPVMVGKGEIFHKMAAYYMAPDCNLPRTIRLPARLRRRINVLQLCSDANSKQADRIGERLQMTQGHAPIERRNVD